MRRERRFVVGAAVSIVTSLPRYRLGGVEICGVELAGIDFERLAALTEERAVHDDVLHALPGSTESIGHEAEAPPRGIARKYVSVIAHERVVARQGTSLTL